MKVKLNPTGRHHLSEDSLKAAMGFIPQYVMGLLGGNDSLRDRLETGHTKLTGSKCQWSTPVSIDEETGVCLRQEDPPLYPLAEFEHLSNKVFIYEGLTVSLFDTKSPDGVVSDLL